MSKKLYCGIKNPTKKQFKGTMKECAEANQLRLWGINKVDKKLLDLARQANKGPTEKKIKKQLDSLSGKAQRLTKEGQDIKKHPSPTKKMSDRLMEIREQLQIIADKYNPLAKKWNALRETNKIQAKREIKAVKKDIKGSLSSVAAKQINDHFDEILGVIKDEDREIQLSKKEIDKLRKELPLELTIPKKSNAYQDILDLYDELKQIYNDSTYEFKKQNFSYIFNDAQPYIDMINNGEKLQGERPYYLKHSIESAIKNIKDKEKELTIKPNPKAIEESNKKASLQLKTTKENALHDLENNLKLMDENKKNLLVIKKSGKKDLVKKIEKAILDFEEALDLKYLINKVTKSNNINDIKTIVNNQKINFLEDKLSDFNSTLFRIVEALEKGKRLPPFKVPILEMIKQDEDEDEGEGTGMRIVDLLY